VLLRLVDVASETSFQLHDAFRLIGTRAAQCGTGAPWRSFGNDEAISVGVGAILVH